MTFERDLFGERSGVPLSVASAFFVSTRTPTATPDQEKTAGWDDAPEEQGALEGQFSVPVEQAVLLMGKCAMHLLRVMSAGLTYTSSIKGPGARAVSSAIDQSDWGHQAAYKYFVERMAVLAGPPHIPESEDGPPPASTNPEQVARRMIRAEQELLACYKALIEVLGDNPMYERVKSYAADCQSHADALWKVLPEEFGGVIDDSAGEEPMAPAVVAPDAGLPEEVEGDELVEEEAPAEKTAGMFRDQREANEAGKITDLERSLNSPALMKAMGRPFVKEDGSLNAMRMGIGNALTGSLAGAGISGGSVTGAALGAASNSGLHHLLAKSQGQHKPNKERAELYHGDKTAASKVLQEKDRYSVGNMAGQTAGLVGGGALGAMAGNALGGKTGALLGGLAGGYVGSGLGGAAGRGIENSMSKKKVASILAKYANPQVMEDPKVQAALAEVDAVPMGKNWGAPALGTVAGGLAGGVAAHHLGKSIGRRYGAGALPLTGAALSGFALGGGGAALGGMAADKLVPGQESRATWKKDYGEKMEGAVQAMQDAEGRLKAPEKVASLLAKYAKEGPIEGGGVDDALKEKGRQRAVTNTASEHSREKARRGERAGKVIGTLAGLGTGAVAGRKMQGAGRIGSMALGGLAGKSLGGELGTEVDIARAKTAAVLVKTAKERGWGEAIGDTVGTIGGGGLGMLAGGTAGLPSGPGAVIAAGAGSTAGALAGGAAGGKLGKKVDEYLGSKEKAASAMVGWAKQAMEGQMAGGEAPMAAPTDTPELEPMNYMQAEIIGRQAQNNNEANFHKQRADAAAAESQQVQQEAAQRIEMAEAQAAQATAESQMADGKVQEALDSAVQSSDQALAKTQDAAALRIGQNDLRMKLMELASQDPNMNAALNLASQPPPEVQPTPEDMAAEAAMVPGETGKQMQEAARSQQDADQQAGQAQATAAAEGAAPGGPPGEEAMKQGSAEIPDAGLLDPKGDAGAAGKAPSLNTAPGSGPVGGGPDMNARSTVTTKHAGLLGAGIGGALGAGSGALHVKHQHTQGLEGANAKVKSLSQAQDGTFAQASALARAQKSVIDRQLIQTHPGRSMGSAALSSAYKGALGGDALENNLRYLAR